ncbi:uncharacterized protein MELLADRAFT_78962 [Melampsora larici-populina 98AG31]|uniref:Uncharacterized protein n=1 Tax=Melampsora larici-populina (strain 98AG31 / pathotype 3-4-7) TaxID=747676 RepID=F4S123_MELLP|nr:uncharacterized protein MELLADRAFT_78962 [Melampsora larici-populina 98AG31]EGG01694.1 hypothetical protein MELLADRAFT_78962 [Melampsora larici-populina 98AG31]
MFGEDDSESPRRPSPFYSNGNSNDTKHTKKVSLSSTSNHSKPKTLREFLEREMNGLSLDQGSWRNEIEPEVDSDGHIEYKLKILSPSPARFEKLTTQLKWRLLEGGGIALYEIGVLDDGTLIGLNSNQMEESLSNLNKMAKELNSYIEISHVIQLPEILIQTTSTSSQNRSLIHQVFKNHMGKSIQHHNSNNNSIGSERKDKGKQRKKKKKLKSKLSNYNLNNRVSQTKTIRIAPGDSAVSSDSETNSPKATFENKTNSLINSLEILKLDTEEPSKKPKVKRWSREIDQRPSRQIERIGGYLDQICLLTPEERCMIKSNLRKEKKNERNKKSKNKETRKAIEEEDGDGDVDGKDLNETKYVVEVKVLKCLDQFEDERFLDFEGFGN